MFSLDRETMTAVAVIVALAAVFYVYQDSQKMKTELLGYKSVSDDIISKLASVQARARARLVPDPKTVTPPPQTEEESNE